MMVFVSMLRITDNGKGFDMTKIEARTTMGLQGMKERLADLGGSLMIESAPGKGARIYASLPYQAALYALNQKLVSLENIVPTPEEITND
jgi:signal transduction histidine kinase